MSEKQVILILEDDVGSVQTKINTELSAPQLMDKLMEIDEQQATINKLKEAIKIAYEEKPFPRIEDIQAKFKELNDDN